MPTRFSVATEGYMLSRRLYLYTLPKPRTPWVPELVSYALSNRAQDVAAKSQFIDLSLVTLPAHCGRECTPRYAATVTNAERLSLDFRFRSGSNQPDSRAERDLDRLVAFLGEQRAPKLLLLGFSDATGDPTSNYVLANERARAIEQALATRGVHAWQVSGFGPAMALASNDSEAGRQRNRRVEVWITR